MPVKSSSILFLGNGYNHVKSKSSESKGQSYKHSERFLTILLLVIKYIKILNHEIKRHHLMGIFRTLSPTTEYAFFKKHFMECFKKIDHILDYEPSLKNFCETSIILTTFSDNKKNF